MVSQTSSEARSAGAYAPNQNSSHEGLPTTVKRPCSPLSASEPTGPGIYIERTAAAAA
jgi:hypothetical protein